MRKGAAGSRACDPKFRTGVGSTFADVAYYKTLSVLPMAFLFLSCYCRNYTIKILNLQVGTTKNFSKSHHLKHYFFHLDLFCRTSIWVKVLYVPIPPLFDKIFSAYVATSFGETPLILMSAAMP